MVNKKIFWEIIKKEIAYYNKTWRGQTEEEKAENERSVLSIYYDALKDNNQFDLEIAFNKHRNTENNFPKVNQLKALLPSTAKEVYEQPRIKSVPMPDNVAKIHNKKQRLSIEERQAMAEMVIQRFRTKREEAERLFNIN